MSSPASATEQVLHARVSELLVGGSLELSPRELHRAADVAALLPADSCIYIPSLPGLPLARTLEAVAAVRAAGLDPVPHVSARRILNRADFRAVAGAPRAAPKTAAVVVPTILSDPEAAGAGRDWLTGEGPGVGWLFPGTDHNPLANTVLIGGAGIKSGLVIGASDFRTATESLSGAHLQLDRDRVKVMGRPFDFTTGRARTDLPAAFAVSTPSPM